MNVNSVEQVREALARAVLVPSTNNRKKAESPAATTPSSTELSPRKFSLLSKSPPSAGTQRKRAGSQVLLSRSASTRTSFSDCEVAPLLKRDEDLVGAGEMLKSAAKNFRFLNLQAPQDVSLTDFSQNLLQELKAFQLAVNTNQRIPQIQGKSVPEEDIKAFWNFVNQVFATQEWTQLFAELIEKLDEERHQGVFLSPREREGLARVQYKEEAEELASHFMSKCTEMSSGIRIVKLDELQRLLCDDRIKSFQIMIEPIKNAACKVMEEAIRDRQSGILFDTVKAVKGAAREAKAKWDEQAKMFPNKHLDIDGINFIAKKCKLKVKVLEDANDSDQQDLEKLIALKEKIDLVLKLILEERG